MLRHRSWVGVLAVFAASSATLAGCGTSAKPTRAQAEVRALFGTVAAEARAHDFGPICDDQLDSELRELLYLVGANCWKVLASDWVEGVQLSKIGPNTRIVVSGKSATIYDGPVPDRAVLTDGRWKLAEMPRNKRHAMSEEAQQTAAQLNPSLRAHHLPEVGSVDPGSLLKVHP
jgi:hypothetical protein